MCVLFHEGSAGLWLALSRACHAGPSDTRRGCSQGRVSPAASSSHALAASHVSAVCRLTHTHTATQAIEAAATLYDDYCRVITPENLLNEESEEVRECECA